MTNRDKPTGITKICTKCGKEKDLTDFHRNKEAKLGRTNECIDCKRKREGRKKHITNYLDYWRGQGVFLSGGYPAVKYGRRGSVRIHRIIAEEKIGRKILPDENVHHVDGNVMNWKPDNIVVLKTKYHRKIEHIRGGGRWKDYVAKRYLLFCNICGKTRVYTQRYLLNKYKTIKRAKKTYRCRNCRTLHTTGIIMKCSICGKEKYYDKGYLIRKYSDDISKRENYKCLLCRRSSTR
jgi:hypothetical protein